MHRTREKASQGNCRGDQRAVYLLIFPLPLPGGHGCERLSAEELREKMPSAHACDAKAEERSARTTRHLRRCAVHTGFLLCAVLVIALCTRVANAEDAAPKLKLRDDNGAEAAAAAGSTASGQQGTTPGLRAEDGNPSVGGRSRDKTCAIPERDKPKLRGDDSAGGDAETKAASEKQTTTAREQAAAKAAAKAREATEKAAALAKPQNGSTVIVDAVEFIDAHSDAFLKHIKEALSGGAGEDTALKDSVLDFLGGQWVNSLLLCQIHEFANGSFVKVPQAVQNYTILVSRIYDNATMHGDAQSQYWLGTMFETGCTLGDGEELIVQDVNQAAQLYMEAGAQVPAANRALGQLLEAHGDVNTAAGLYTKSLELGDVRSLSLLGRLYEDHGSVEEAVDLYTQGANIKEPLAMTSLALLLLDGKIVTKDVSRAIELLTEAASHLECSAFYMLGRVLEGGVAVEKNPKTAASFYEIAANLGHVGAAAELARLYNEGMGVEADSEKALSWAQKASDGGMEWADASDAAKAKTEYASLKAPLLGGRPSRYEYVPIVTYPLSKEEKAVQDAKGFTGMEPAPGMGETARFRYAAAADYFKMPSVLWDTRDAAKAA